ncbi:MAG: hypothetical protein J1E62_10410 [Lachnospiraceae bacterium]|nr:hypothetical protein [Lachnospiraceae bacterium]
MKAKHRILLLLLLIILTGIYYYVCFPSINIHKEEFWASVIFLLVLLGVLFAVRTTVGQFVKLITKKSVLKDSALGGKFFFALAGLCVCIVVVGGLMSATVFRAKTYATLLPVEEREFTEDIVESERVTDIALMDTQSARIFGNRKIGSLSDVVSQFEVEPDYTQISIEKKPMKVSGLKYASFFKWWNNRDNGIPGYVRVNPVNSDAEYVKLDQGMKYVPSGFFNDNLQRHVQICYPTKIVNGYHFEVDDEGAPFYVCPTVTATIGLFGGVDVNGVIICDPVSGACSYYDIKDCPAWVDCAYDGHLLERKYNWNGMLSGGFINSIIGQKGCKQTTDDFGYKIIGDDVWVYTGVTSVNGDQSNIGFVMMNQRTSEARYYRVSGAEEHSAMSAAEGEVQEKGYKAAFPSLINVSGVPTYVMVLKDAGGLVKLYAMVNVEQYNIVATATTQTKVFENYKKLLAADDSVTTVDSESEEAEVTVESIEYINTEEGTVVYIKDTEHRVYKQSFKDNEALIRISAGDRIKVTYMPMEDEIHLLEEFSFIE